MTGNQLEHRVYSVANGWLMISTINVAQLWKNIGIAFISVILSWNFLVSRHQQEIEGSFLSVAEKQILTHMSLHQFGKGKVIKGFF